MQKTRSDPRLPCVGDDDPVAVATERQAGGGEHRLERLLGRQTFDGSVEHDAICACAEGGIIAKTAR